MSLDRPLKGIEVENLGRTILYPEEFQEDAQSILSGEEYPIQLAQLEKVTRIVDIGAHVGLATIFFHCLFPEARITSYEPLSKSFELLSENTKGLSSIEVRPFGLGQKEEVVPLYLSREFGLAASSSFYNEQDHLEEAEQISIRPASLEPAFQDGGEISILKIDTEGFEVPILLDLESVLDRVLILFMEVHSESDRVALDRYLAPRFYLRHCHVPMIHRYTVMYVNKNAVATGRVKTRGAPALGFTT